MLMQFVWLYIDDLAGKGLDTWVVVQLLFYVSASIIPLALPLSVLLASIMTFGNLGESYELIALKAAGISIWRIFLPMFFVMLLISITAFFISNTLIPKAILKQKSLLYDIKQQKPALLIKEGVFYDGIEGINMRIGSKDAETNELFDIIIYDRRNSYMLPVILTAERGTMVMSDDNRFLFFNLYNGTRYEELDRQAGYDRTHPSSMLHFSEQQVVFDLLSFSFNRTDENLFKEGFQMLNVNELNRKIDTIVILANERIVSVQSYYHTHLRLDDTISTGALKLDVPVVDSILKGYHGDKSVVIATALNNVRAIKSTQDYVLNEMKTYKDQLIRYEMEWHKKFTLSVACLVMFFIGAPFGTIIRKGGFGMPVVISVLLYIVFHIVSLIGEKMSKSGTMSPANGMWFSIFVLVPIAFFLTYQAANDSGLFDKSAWLKLAKKIIPNKSKV
jgi:lipopolysaccharide export system permease protein